MTAIRQKMLGFMALMFLGSVSMAWGNAAKNLSAADTWELLQKKSDIFILDVRTMQEYMQLRLEGATLIPIDQVVGRIDEIPRDRPIMVYCAVGSRSSQVANYLAQQGYEPVYNMYGGIWAWRSRGLPVLDGPP